MINNNKKHALKNLVKNNTLIKKCKNELDVLYVLSQYNNNCKTLYKLKKQEYDKLLISQRRLNYENKIKNSDNKTKCMWGIYKEVTNNFKSDKMLEGDPVSIAKEYNEFLLKYTNNIKMNLGNNYENISYNDRSMFVYPVTEIEILTATKRLKNKESCGDDEISTNIIK